MSLVNPLTVLGFVDIAKQLNAKTIIHTAAASSLGRMVNRYLPTEKINVIHIVRRQEQVDILKNEGAKYILNSS
jgi:NADPH2:quinone reductase